jgi:hypothetical protein
LQRLETSNVKNPLQGNATGIPKKTNKNQGKFRETSNDADNVSINSRGQPKVNPIRKKAWDTKSKGS